MGILENAFSQSSYDKVFKFFGERNGHWQKSNILRTGQQLDYKETDVNMGIKT